MYMQKYTYQQSAPVALTLKWREDHTLTYSQAILLDGMLEFIIHPVSGV